MRWKNIINFFIIIIITIYSHFIKCDSCCKYCQDITRKRNHFSVNDTVFITLSLRSNNDLFTKGNAYINVKTVSGNKDDKMEEHKLFYFDQKEMKMAPYIYNTTEKLLQIDKITFSLKDIESDIEKKFSCEKKNTYDLRFKIESPNIHKEEEKDKKGEKDKEEEKNEGNDKKEKENKEDNKEEEKDKKGEKDKKEEKDKEEENTKKKNEPKEEYYYFLKQKNLNKLFVSIPEERTDGKDFYINEYVGIKKNKNNKHITEIKFITLDNIGQTEFEIIEIYFLNINTLISIELLQTAIQGRDDVTYTVNCHIYDLNKDEKEDKEKYFSKKIYNNDTTIDLTI